MIPAISTPTPGSEPTLYELVGLDFANPSRLPVWTAQQGAIVELLCGRRSVKLPEVVS